MVWIGTPTDYDQLPAAPLSPEPHGRPLTRRRRRKRRGLDISQDLSLTGWAYIRRKDSADEPQPGAFVRRPC